MSKSNKTVQEVPTQEQLIIKLSNTTVKMTKECISISVHQ